MHLRHLRHWQRRQTKDTQTALKTAARTYFIQCRAQVGHEMSMQVYEAHAVLRRQR